MPKISSVAHLMSIIECHPLLNQKMGQTQGICGAYIFTYWCLIIWALKGLLEFLD